MRYGIVVNPVAGGTSVDEKRELLEQIREVLGGDCAIAGLDTESAEQFRSLATEYAGRVEVLIAASGDGSMSDDVATAVVTKIPYYGYKMNILPEAVFDDGFLYLRVFDDGWPQILAGLAKARLLTGETESFHRARRIEIRTRDKRYLHIDGNVARQGDAFRFQVLPGALRMWY